MCNALAPSLVRELPMQANSGDSEASEKKKGNLSWQS